MRPERPYPSTGTLNVLVTGDSHSKDTFNMFALNPDLYPGLAFNRLRAETSEEKKNHCFLDDPDKLESIIGSDVFRDSNVVIISERFRKNRAQTSVSRPLHPPDQGRRQDGNSDIAQQYLWAKAAVSQSARPFHPIGSAAE